LHLMAHDPPIKCHQTLPMQSNHDRPSHTELYTKEEYIHWPSYKTAYKTVCVSNTKPPKKASAKTFSSYIAALITHYQVLIDDPFLDITRTNLRPLLPSYIAAIN
jgi:deoxyribodipyrimidine photolyase